MKKGFTLIELLAVIILVSALFTIVMTMISGQIRNEEATINEAELKTYCAGAKLYADKENYSSSLKEIKLIDLENSGIFSNLSDKYKKSKVYVQYVGNLFCCCADKDGKVCNQSRCNGTVNP